MSYASSTSAVPESLRSQRRLLIGLVISVLIHALILTLQFGIAGIGIPALTLPDQAQRSPDAAISVHINDVLPLPPVPAPEVPSTDLAAPAPVLPMPNTGFVVVAPLIPVVPEPAPTVVDRKKIKVNPDIAPVTKAARPSKRERPVRVITQEQPNEKSFALPTPEDDGAISKSSDAMGENKADAERVDPTVMVQQESQRLAEKQEKEEEQRKKEVAAVVVKEQEKQALQQQEVQQQAAEKALKEAQKEARAIEAAQLAQASLLQKQQEQQQLQQKQQLAEQARQQENVRQQSELAQQRLLEEAKEKAHALDLAKLEQQRAEQVRLAQARQEEIRKEDARKEELRKQTQIQDELRRQAQVRQQQAAEQAAQNLRQQQEELAQKLAQEQALAKQQEMAAKQKADDQAARQKAEALAALQRGKLQDGQAQGAENGSNKGTGGGSALVLPKGLLGGGDLASRALEQAPGLDVLRGKPPRMRADDDRDKSRRRAIIGNIERDVSLRMYMESWRQKIERNGNFNYAQRGSGSLVLTIMIRSDGSIEDIVINRSSGRADLDDAAKRIARINARYASFPPAIAAQYDVVEIRRVWNFEDVLKISEELP